MPQPSPMVSVIVPTYNREKYIKQAIDSILQQTFTDFELIVVDDGSTDQTAELVQQIPDDRIRYVYRENGGTSEAVNTGISHIRGEYFTKLDSDDLWEDTLLEDLVSSLESNPQVGAVYARAQYIDEAGNKLDRFRGWPMAFPENPFKSFLFYDTSVTITTLIRRSAMDEVGIFDGSNICSEDWDYIIRVAKITKVIYLDKVLGYVRSHSSNKTGGDPKYLYERTWGRVRILDKFFGEPDLPQEIVDFKSDAYDNFYLHLLLYWLGERKVIGVGQAFIAGLKRSTNKPKTLRNFGARLWEIFQKRFLS
jgi:glycosyltransferase involved in cell wall biosynthesis